MATSRANGLWPQMLELRGSVRGHMTLGLTHPLSLPSPTHWYISVVVQRVVAQDG